ncbi:23714_t:CDS:2 [Dentiscutata erythropus]|uniref:23714_t:CDS:1 n=1 Tax=Dentiscutata erythropus TaxID=1348616 RepID=A0A9N9N6U2_9GLOM|nr:23714_t:CDS:2 [Dentiscutata erythropus]
MSTEIDAPVQVTEPDPSSQIYKATYSGVPVWEFRLALYQSVRSVAVMRRKTDSWLNATQILKVAEFDKPHRTRILEREVQKGEHEKVQGGYGKYQGTWVPYQTGVDLAERYHVKELLQPIIEFQPSLESPPLAPKHVTAASNKPRKPREPKEPKPIKPRPPKKLKKPEPQAEVENMSVDTDHETAEIASIGSSNASISPIYSLSASPAPNESSNDLSESDETPTVATIPKQKRKRKQADTGGRASKVAKTVQQYSNAVEYGSLMLTYFTTNSDAIPDFILHPPSDFDANIIIDQQGHTALHWAAAMANYDMASLLVKAGADPDRGNVHGETALMRSVMFQYNYENRCFHDIVQLLIRTIGNLDIHDQTVLHHIAIYATTKGRIGPSRYYMEVILSTLAQHPNEEYRRTIINKQNDTGDTALNISARSANKRLILKLEIQWEKNAEDYILELDHDAKYRAEQSRVQNQPPNNNENHVNSAPSTPIVVPTGASRVEFLLQDANTILRDFKDMYVNQIQIKEKELSVCQAQLASNSEDLEKTNRMIEGLREKARTLPVRKERVNELINLVTDKIESQRNRRLDNLVSEEMTKMGPITDVNPERVKELAQQIEGLKVGRLQMLKTVVEIKKTPDTNLSRYKRDLNIRGNSRPSHYNISKQSRVMPPFQAREPRLQNLIAVSRIFGQPRISRGTNFAYMGNKNKS